MYNLIFLNRSSTYRKMSYIKHDVFGAPIMECKHKLTLPCVCDNKLDQHLACGN